MSDNVGILSLRGGIIINTDNITYNREIHEFITATSNMSFNKLLNIIM